MSLGELISGQFSKGVILAKNAHVKKLFEEPGISKEAARAAVETLISYAGDNPHRPGLVDTPRRVTEAFKELFAGYSQNPIEYLEKTFEDANGYNQPVIVSGITFQSTCEHHMLPFMGVAHVAYIPKDRVVGLSKLCRVVQAYARRLQMQERLTQQIADCISTGLDTSGVAVILEAYHTCMMVRGVQSEQARTTTMILQGAFEEDPRLEGRLMRAVNSTPLNTTPCNGTSGVPSNGSFCSSSAKESSK
jgi:GTP cyclohydrolase I